MKLVLIGVGGVVAHVVSHVVAQYSQWLFAKVLRGDVLFVFVEDLKQFGRWLVRSLAGQLGPRQSWATVDPDQLGHRQSWAAEEPDWQPELYGS